MTRDDPAAFAPPPAFGPFRVLHQIGIGALGPVFRTYEPTRDRLVAVKLFRLDITPEQSQALADELTRACDAGLFHPSIVEPIAAGVEGTAAYRAEEYVAAESLDVAIRHYAPAALDKALPFITQLAGAIDFARTAGVGHGGLHLRDVFVTPDEARASGFGIVESLERVGIRAPVRRPYSAPERIAGDAWSTPADVFSLAAIAYELLTGRRPSGTGDQIGALTGGNAGEYADAVRRVLARAMDDDPARRYASALAFASALEAAAGGRTMSDAAPVGALAAAAVIAESAAMKPAPAEAQAVAAPAPIEELTLADVETDVEQGAGVPEPIEVGPIAPSPIEQVAAADDLRRPEDEPAPTLFDAEDEEEPLRDLAIDEPPRRETPPMWQYEPPPSPPVMDAREEFTEPERPRLPMLPLAFTLIVGLLIGFAAGYAMAERESSAPQPTAAAAVPPPTPAPAPAQGSQPQRSGQAWSEQAVAPPNTQPAATPPPVPGDAPSAPPPTAAGPARTTPSRRAVGSIRVESTPRNAAVTVNGTWRGRTPLTIDDLTLGTHTIRVVQPGYTVAREDVTLSQRQPSRTLSFRLQRPGRATAAAPPRSPAPSRTPPPARNGFAGSLYVASNPPGARVYVDGRPMGTTPARIPEVAIGSHVVRLELPDHRVWTTSTRVAAGQETRVTGSLERIQ